MTEKKKPKHKKKHPWKKHTVFKSAGEAKSNKFYKRYYYKSLNKKPIEAIVPDDIKIEVLPTISQESQAERERVREEARKYNFAEE